MDEIIVKHRLPSPPGTFMISAAVLDKVDCPNIKDSLIFRISRYVSPEAWGSPKAELGRRKSSVERLRHRMSASSKTSTSICAGSHVWWRPLPVKCVSATVDNVSHGEITWLAQRQPPSLASAARFFSVEIKKELLDWRDKRVGKTTEVLFDRRFVIRIDPEKVPQNILDDLSLGSKVVIEPSQHWFLPEVMLRGEENAEPVHTHVNWPYDWRKFWHRKSEVYSNWISIEYIRPISAI